MRLLAILALVEMSILTAASTRDEVESIVTNGLLDAIAAVESGKDDTAVNVAEDAHGRYQIRAGYLADANESLGTSYTLEDMHDPDKAAAVVRAYLTRYGFAAARRSGTWVTQHDLARIHNGGPRGDAKSETIGYADRVIALVGGDDK